MDKHHLLICTVGKPPQPILAAIKHWKPARVLFVHSADTKATVEAITQKPEFLQPGAWDMVEVHDGQDFGDCVRRMRSLDERIANWRRQGADRDVIVDFTGGTKCMTAALSLIARRWPCEFSYVGGTERTEGGTVVSGKEQTLVTQNPWNTLGYQAIEDACLMFDRHAFAPAARLLHDARKAAGDEAVKRSLSTFHELCEAYGSWDRFEHKDAAQRLATVRKNGVDLEQALGTTHSEAVMRRIKEHHKTLRQLVEQPCSKEMVADLIANAGRRKSEGRFDDGVARLYRAIESVAQLALSERHSTSTDDVQLDHIPEVLRERWTPRAMNGKLLLGLQDAYVLLESLGDELGKEFQALGLHAPKCSPLTVRNQSILAHGFQPVGPNVFEQLWDAALKLGKFSDDDLPTFPKLTQRSPTGS